MAPEIPWPDAHIRRSLATAPTDQRRVVLLMTGALNPVHRGHLAMMAQARRFLTAQGALVLGGWLSPSNDHYVQSKYARRETRAYTAAQRRAMCRAACADQAWLACAAWESLVPDRWPDFPEVVQAGHDHVSALSDAPVVTAYVCGGDHLRHLPRGLHDPAHWVVAVPRIGQTLQARPEHGVFVTPADPATAAISATQVRDALEQGSAAAADLLPPGVWALLRTF